MNNPWSELHAARKAHGWTQQAAAKGIVSQPLYSLIEQGVVMPAPDVIDKLASRLATDAHNWHLAWRPHRQKVQQKILFWRTFVNRNEAKLNNLLHASADMQLLDIECYRHWLVAQKTSAVTLLQGELDKTRTKLHAASSLYLPRSMRSVGDPRLQTVLAIVEAMVNMRVGRHQASAIWTLRAHRMYSRIPPYLQ